MALDDINFYGRKDPYYEFSNFFKSPIQLEGQKWPTVEHFFQARKFIGTVHEKEVGDAATAMQAAKMGRERKRPLRADWDSVKDDVMYEGVLAKFSQHTKLKNVLLGTGDAKIVEHTKNDSYWGDGGDGSGKNQLGKTLMKVRTALRASESGKKNCATQKLPDEPPAKKAKKATTSALWHEAIENEEFDKIRVKTCSGTFSLRENQEEELKRWHAGKWDRDWLQVKDDKPQAFISQSGEQCWIDFI